MVGQGNWLFKYRSYVPLPVFFLALFLSALYGPFIDSQGAGRAWEFACFGISIIGLLIRVLTAGYVPSGTSGRNTQSQVADSLNTTGFYSMVRNPLYLGNFIMSLGAVLYVRSWVFALAYIVFFFFYYERIIYAEEAFLRKKFGKTYLEWAERIPMLFPRGPRWSKPLHPFSFRLVIRQEFTTLSATVFTFTCLKLLEGFLTTKSLLLDPVWLWIFGITQGAYLVVLILIKGTSVLKVERKGQA